MEFKSVLKLLKLLEAEAFHQLEYYPLHSNKEGVKPDLTDTDRMKLVHLLIYWRYFPVPEVCLFKKLAGLVFSILSSSSKCETNFRDHEYIMDKRRLRLKPQLAEKLIFIYCNKKINKI